MPDGGGARGLCRTVLTGGRPCVCVYVCVYVCVCMCVCVVCM